MSEFKRITKAQAKMIKHLLNSASTDLARPLLTAICVNVEDDHISSADGFRLTFVKYKESQLETIFPISGIFKVTLGKIQREDIVEITELTNSNYPKLTSVLHPADKPVTFVFSINKNLLTSLLKDADSTVMIKLWDKVETAEISYKVSDHQCYSAIMPMHTPDDEKRWQPKAYIPESKK